MKQIISEKMIWTKEEIIEIFESLSKEYDHISEKEACSLLGFNANIVEISKPKYIKEYNYKTTFNKIKKFKIAVISILKDISVVFSLFNLIKQCFG